MAFQQVSNDAQVHHQAIEHNAQAIHCTQKGVSSAISQMGQQLPGYVAGRIHEALEMYKQKLEHQLPQAPSLSLSAVNPDSGLVPPKNQCLLTSTPT